MIYSTGIENSRDWNSELLFLEKDNESGQLSTMLASSHSHIPKFRERETFFSSPLLFKHILHFFFFTFKFLLFLFYQNANQIQSFLPLNQSHSFLFFNSIHYQGFPVIQPIELITVFFNWFLVLFHVLRLTESRKIT